MRKSLTTAVSLALVGAVFGLSAPADAAKQDMTKAQKRFSRLDTDKNGVLDPRELTSATKKHFKRLDLDNDSHVTSDELAKFARMRIEKRRKVSVTDKRMKKINARMEKYVARYDGDGDGRLSSKEFLKRPHPLLKRGDTDGDGVVSQAEFDQLVEKRRARRAGK